MLIQLNILDIVLPVVMLLNFVPLIFGLLCGWQLYREIVQDSLWAMLYVATIRDGGRRGFQCQDCDNGFA